MSSFNEITAQRLKDDGNVLLMNGSFAEALLKYDEALSLKGDFKEALLNGAVCCRYLNEFENAILRIVRAIECDVHYTKAYHQLAKIFEAIGKLSPNSRDPIFTTCKNHLSNAGLMNKDARYKLHFMIVDLKVNRENEVKVLEFGDGIRSGGDITNEKLSGGVNEIVGLPLLLSSEIGIPILKAFDLNESVELWRRSQPHTGIDLPFCGVFGGCETVPVPEDVLLLNADPQTIALLDEKVYMHELFYRADLLHYRPISKVYWKQYHANMAADICASIPGESVMVKNSDGCRGDGVIIVQKSKLDATLKILLADVNNLQATARNIDRDILLSLGDSIVTWTRTQRHVFVVEEIVRSKPVKFDGKTYDPAMRVAFLMYESPDRDAATILPLSYYWKFPVDCVSNECSRGSTISSFKLGVDPRRDDVSADDRHLVHAALQNILPPLFQSARTLSYDSPLQSLQSFDTGVCEDLLHAKQVDAMRVLLANLSGHCGHYAAALYYIYEFAARNPSSDTGRYETAMAHLLCRNLEEAIRIFRETSYDVKFFRIAQAYRLQGKIVEAKNAINLVPTHMKNDPRVMIERQLIYAAV